MMSMDRRSQLKLWSALILGGVGLHGQSHAAQGADKSGRRKLRVLAWPGYAEPEVVKSFEQAHQVSVEVITVDNDEALWKRVMSPDDQQHCDVFAANTAELQRYIQLDVVSPVPVDWVPQMQRQLPRFQPGGSPKAWVRGQAVMAVPFTHAEMGLIYDRNAVVEVPTSINALWDPRYRGKVLAYDGGTHNFSLAAQALGVADPFRLKASEWSRVVAKLIELRRNVAAFYTYPDESLNLFRRRGAVLLFANYGSQQLSLFRRAGLDVGYAIPKEGALAWLDCWAIRRGSAHPELAAAWINHLLGKEASDLLVNRQGLSSTITDSMETHPSDKLVWLETPEDEPRRSALWSRIVSGDRLQKVLTP